MLQPEVVTKLMGDDEGGGAQGPGHCHGQSLVTCVMCHLASARVQLAVLLHMPLRKAIPELPLSPLGAL